MICIGFRHQKVSTRLICQGYAPEILFWTVWDDIGDEDVLIGCGALKELDATHGEIKSMRTSSQHRRKGVARAVLTHIIEEAKRRGYRRLSLETGAQEPFQPAHRLYEWAGFALWAFW